MIVVSDASPLGNLGRIGKLSLLHDSHGDIVVPEAVWQEVVVEGKGRPGEETIGAADWVKVQEVKNRELVRSLIQQLDAGESEAIALAVESQADLLLMDEKLGREVAQHFGLRFIGVVGMLAEAKKQGDIKEIKPILDDLRYKAGFRVSDDLYNRVLKDTGEM